MASEFALQAAAALLPGIGKALGGGGGTKVTQNTSLSSTSNTALNITNTTGGQGAAASGAPITNSTQPYAASADYTPLAPASAPAFGALGSDTANYLNNVPAASGGASTLPPLSKQAMAAMAVIVLGVGYMLFAGRGRK